MKNWTQRWSRYLLYFILAVLPLERIPSLDLSSPIHATIRLSQVAGLILVLINLPMLWRKKAQIVSQPWVYLLVFVAISLVSAITSSHHLRSMSVWVFTTFEIVLAWTIMLVAERNKYKTYAWIIIWSAVAVCLFGIYQFFGDLLGLPASLTGLRDLYTSAVYGFPRIQSTGLEPLYFDDFLLIPIALLVAMISTRSSRKLWLALIFISTVLLANVSRGATIALVGMALVAITWFGVKKAWRSAAIVAGSLIAAGLLAMALVAVGSHIATNRNANTNDALKNFKNHATDISSGESAEGRTITRHLALTATKENSFLGVGPGNFGFYSHEKLPKKFGDNSAIVNNEPLEILSETGVLGLAAFLGFVVSLLWLIWKHWKDLDGTTQWFAGGLILALIGVAGQYQTFSTLYITHIWVAIGLLVGALNYGQDNATRS
jgi:O-antigen ligase